MVVKRSTGDQAPAPDKVLADFLKAEADAPSVHDLEQRLELHLSGTSGYVPSYTRRVMDKNHGAPIMAIETRTYNDTKRVFLQPVNPNDKRGRKLRKDETLGPAVFAFGVPLRKLGIKLPTSRRIILPLTPLETPDHGIVYWASLADIEHERRDVDMELAAAAKQAKADKTKTRKADRLKKHTDKPETGAQP
jgi:hypothetical protein